MTGPKSEIDGLGPLPKLHDRRSGAWRADRPEAIVGAAKLAALAVVALALVITPTLRAGDPVTLETPQPMKATLADGRTIAGGVSRWDDSGFEGAIGRFRWADFKPIEAYRVRKKLIEPLEDARKERMLDVVAWCWSIDEGKLAERASDDARRFGAQDSDLVAAKVRGIALKQDRAAQEARAERERLRTASPEGERFSEAPWPAAVEADRADHVKTLRSETTAKLAAAGRETTAIESRHAIVYSDLGAEDAAQRGVDVDEFVAASLSKLGLPPESLPFWGKLVVIVADGADRFRLLEASGFRQLAGPDDVVFAHYDGPKAFVLVRTQPDATATRIALWRGVALAILHRHVSAKRLPPWANEGFADWLVASFARGKLLDEQLRKPGLAFVRGGGSLEQVIELTYAASSWPGQDGAGRPAGYLLAGFMAEQEPARFRRFVAAVKQGKAWKQALAEDFGASSAELIAIARKYYRTND